MEKKGLIITLIVCITLLTVLAKAAETGIEVKRSADDLVRMYIENDNDSTNAQAGLKLKVDVTTATGDSSMIYVDKDGQTYINQTGTNMFFQSGGSNMFTANPNGIDLDYINGAAGDNITNDEHIYWDGSNWQSSDVIEETELSSISNLETQISDVTNIWTNNDGNLDDDDITDDNLSDLNDCIIGGAPSSDDVLTWDGDSWEGASAASVTSIAVNDTFFTGDGSVGDALDINWTNWTDIDSGGEVHWANGEDLTSIGSVDDADIQADHFLYFTQAAPGGGTKDAKGNWKAGVSSTDNSLEWYYNDGNGWTLYEKKTP